MGINEREYMRRPISPPLEVIYAREARPTPADPVEPARDQPKTWKLLRAFARELGVLIGLTVIIGAIGIGQIWLWQHSDMAQFATVATSLAAMIAHVFLCVGFARHYRSVFALPLDLLGALVQAGSLTGLVVLGAAWFGADFTPLREVDLTSPTAIPVFIEIVDQTPWWYLLFCCVCASSLGRSDELKSLHWRFGSRFTFLISGAYFVAKILIDTGMYAKLS